MKKANVKIFAAFGGLALLGALTIFAFIYHGTKGKKRVIPEKAWIKPGVYDMIKEVPVTHWRGSLLFQMPRSDREAPTLIAVPSCRRRVDGSHTLYKWWILNPYKGEVLSSTGVNVQKNGTRVWVFSPPSLPQGKKRTRKYLDPNQEPATTSVEMLRIEVIKGANGWAVRSIDRLRKNKDPWVTQENYFYGQWLTAYQEKASNVGDLECPDYRFFKGTSGLHLQYGKYPHHYGFSRVCH
ncbi:MAG: hypothetical protein HQ530_02505 [Parcubacteria group bacterium]|nr:hypothetical protein [Parcubacteria group bacterium]